jgi:hypothetical protein
MIVSVVRTGACALMATTTAVIGWVWFNAPHESSSPGYHVSSTYNTAVGMVDLYMLHDPRGYERLVEIDPSLQAVGGDAARTVMLDDAHFSIETRVDATRRLADHAALDAALVEDLALTTKSHGERTAFCDIEPTLDARLGCGS